jgi:hypothetical protein
MQYDVNQRMHLLRLTTAAVLTNHCTRLWSAYKLMLLFNARMIVLHEQIYDKSMPPLETCNVRIPVAHGLQPQEANYTSYNRYVLQANTTYYSNGYTT